MRGAFGLVGILLVTACIAPLPKEVDSLDVGELAEGDGIFVVRFFTTLTERDHPGSPDPSPDLHYTVGFSDSSVSFGTLSRAIGVEAAEGPALVVRKVPAGDYFFNEIVMDHPGGFGGGPGAYITFPCRVAFSVAAGRINYLGDLHVNVLEESGLLGLGKTFRCKLEHEFRSAEVQARLAGSYPGSAGEIVAASVSIR